MLLAASIRSAPAETESESLRLLDSVSLSAGLHWGVPCGALSFLSATPAFRLGASSSYAEAIRATGFVQYARLDDTIGIHYATAGAGLTLLWGPGLSVSGQLVLHYARSTRPHAPAMLLDGGESEFGTDLGLAWTLNTGSLSLRPGVQASLAFTRPSPSWWIWSGLDVDWSLW